MYFNKGIKAERQKLINKNLRNEIIEINQLGKNPVIDNFRSMYICRYSGLKNKNKHRISFKICINRIQCEFAFIGKRQNS